MKRAITKDINTAILAQGTRYSMVLISQLRAGHMRCGHYLHRVGKRPTKECQCGVEDENVPHILLRCGLT